MIKDGRKPFLVAVNKSNTRDSQITSEKNKCIDCTHLEECSRGECPVPLREYKDFHGHIIIGQYNARDKEGAILTCSIHEKIDKENLIAFELK